MIANIPFMYQEIIIVYIEYNEYGLWNIIIRIVIEVTSYSPLRQNTVTLHYLINFTSLHFNNNWDKVRTVT